MNGFDMRWVAEPDDPEVRDWLRETVQHTDPADTSGCPKDKHTSVPVQAVDQMALVDTGMAELVYHLFCLGIGVAESCEHTYTSDGDGDGDRGVLAALQFDHIDDMQTVVTLIAKENPEDGSFYARVTGDYLDRDEIGDWMWHIRVSTIGRKPILQPILTFPVSDLEEFTLRLAAAAL